MPVCKILRKIFLTEVQPYKDNLLNNNAVKCKSRARPGPVSALIDRSLVLVATLVDY